MCIDITPDMQYLVAGYKSGAVALWNIKNVLLEKVMPNIHESEVT